MSRKDKPRIDTAGGQSLGMNPFGGLDALPNLPAAPRVASGAQALEGAQPAGAAARIAQNGCAARSGEQASAAKASVGSGQSGAGGTKNFSGRIDIRWEKSGRGGKVVTTLSGAGLATLGATGREVLLKQIKSRFGCGGRCEGSLLEVQGNLVGQLTPFLAAQGWHVVRSGS